MHASLFTSLALGGIAAGAALPSGSTVRLSPGFKIPEGGANGLYKHVFDPASGEVTTTFLGELAQEGTTLAAFARRDTPPPWPSDSEITCTNDAYSVNHVQVAQGQLGDWCASHTLAENTNFSYTNYDVAVFVCNYAHTITNDCSADQLNTALMQSSAQCGAGVTTSNAYPPWYKAYGIATPGTYVCNQDDQPPV